MKKLLSVILFFILSINTFALKEFESAKPFEINHYYYWVPIGDGCYQLVQETELVGDNGVTMSTYTWMNYTNWTGTYLQCNNSNTSIWDTMC